MFISFPRESTSVAVKTLQQLALNFFFSLPFNCKVRDLDLLIPKVFKLQNLWICAA